MRILAAMLFALVASAASAHKPSDAYLTIERDGEALSARWDIALRDLGLCIGALALARLARTFEGLPSESK